MKSRRRTNKRRSPSRKFRRVSRNYRKVGGIRWPFTKKNKPLSSEPPPDYNPEFGYLAPTTPENSIPTPPKGGSIYSFGVVLFSEEPPSEEIKSGVKTVLEGLYGEVEVIIDDPIRWMSFEGVTGLNEKFSGKSEILYRIVRPPIILSNKGKHVDDRLTVLEGQIGLALLDSGIDVSLIEGAHGIRPETNVNGENTYMVGLCTPKCSVMSRNSLYSYTMR